MIEITCDVKDTLNLSELTDFQGELKHRSKNDVDKIITSIQKFGFATPFFVWSHDGINHVLDGHGRLLALKRLAANGEKIPPLPIVHIDCKDEATAKKLLLRITSQFGEMTSDSVIEFMEGLEIDVEELSLPDGTLEFDFPTNETETDESDDAPEVEDEAVSELGEIYQLGDSFLMCGDSTSEDDISRLMSGAKADMVFTDFFYGMNLDTDYSTMKSKLKSASIDGGSKYAQGKVDDFSPDMIKSILSLDADEVFIWGADYFSELLPDKNDGSWIVWDKRANGNDDIKADESSDKMYGSCFELCWSKKKHKRDIARVKWAGVFGMEKEFDKKRVHPTQKPIRLIKWFLERYGEKTETVVDLFGGSGSTLIACAEMGKSARLMELDPHYCDVIRRRYTQWAKNNNKPITSGCLE